MSGPGESNPSYTVIQFSLETGPDRTPTQRTKNWGSHACVEAAFVNARCLANLTMQRLRRDRPAEVPALVDTEWGYDLRLGPLTVDRFWVHENTAGRRLLC